MTLRLLLGTTSVFLYVALPVFGQTSSTTDQQPFVFTKNHKLCLHTYRTYGPVDLCTDGELTKDERVQKAEATRVRDAERAERLKPDPRTPRFNVCMSKYRPNDYHLAGAQCRDALSADVSALRGWFTKGEAAETAERSGKERLALMQEISNEEVDEISDERATRRLRQTPLQNAIEKANEPCMYADENNIMRSCN